jgi:hypothetical protein
MNDYRVKPGKGVSLLSFFGALAMGLFGVFFLLPMVSSAGAGVGPMGSAQTAFVLIWILVAFGTAAYYGYNAFSERGVSMLDIEPPAAPPVSPPSRATPAADFDERLRKLEGLRRDSVITDAEYETKRAEILRERW